MFLLNHKQGVAAQDHQIDLSFSSLFFIGNPHRFKHVPSVGFTGGSAQLAEPLFSQIASSMDVVGRVVSSPFAPPRPPLFPQHGFT